MGSQSWNRMQFGAESPSTHGTLAAATGMFIGQMPPIKTDTKWKYPKEHFGLRSDAYRSVNTQKIYQNTWAVEDASFQHLLLPFGLGIKGAVTAIEQTVDQDDYLWDFTPSLEVANSPDSASLRFGDDVQAFITKYAMVERIRISGQIVQSAEASPVKLEWDFFGDEIVTGSFTNGLAVPDLEPMNAKFAQLYLDSSWANVGVTELANVLRDFDIEMITGVHPKWAGKAASKKFTRHAEGIISVMGTFGIEAGSEANALFAAHQAGTFKVARLSISGGQIGTGDNHNLSLDFCGSFEDVTPISGADRDDNLATFVLHGYAETTTKKSLGLTVTTDRNTY